MRVAKLGLVTVVVALAACKGGASAPGIGAHAPSEAASRASCVATGRSPLRPVAGPSGRAGGAVALASAGPRSLALVADEDDHVLHTVDVAEGVELAATPLAGAPSHALVTPDGRVVVLLRDRAEMQVFEADADVARPLAERCRVSTADEPVDLTLTPDDATLLVTTGWGARVSGYQARSLAWDYDVPLSREPRAVVVADDGAHAFVSHMVGAKLSVIDLKTKRAQAVALVAGGPTIDADGSLTGEDHRAASQGYALAKSAKPSPRVLAPMVLVEPGQPRTNGYGSSESATEEPTVAALSGAGGAVTPDSVHLGARTHGRGHHGITPPSCLLPRAAVVEETRGELLVACLGDDVVIAYDAHAASPWTRELRRWHVAAGPTGIAVDGARGRAIVWSQFGRTLGIVDLVGPSFEDQLTATQTPVIHVPLSRRAGTAHVADVALGRRLFHAAGDRRIAADGRACASCHPDGRDDALTWGTPDGPRQTPSLAGRLAGTAPYSWMGTGRDVRQHLSHTLARLGGEGLPPHEIDALVAYVQTMAPPPRSAPRPMDGLLARGEAIFRSAEAGCASCHGDGRTPDGLRHDVGSAAPLDGTHEFDTPSLRFVGGTGPYFHDGRYVTLREVLIDADGTMGRTHHLSPAELDALEVFVRAL